ncbi:MAG: tol-pal system YbgF family protein [Saprospiraceae bacterium]
MNGKNVFLLTLIILLIGLIYGCNRPFGRNALQQQIEYLQQQLAEDLSIVKLDTIQAKTLIKESEKFATQFSRDTLAPVYLFRAADVARGIGQYQQAVALWEWVQKEYPTFDKAPESLFFQGFTYENDLGKPELARSYYERFIEKYPTHPLLATVQSSLLNLTETPAELIERFKKQH